MFGILIPGRPIISQLVPVQPGIWLTKIPLPKEISEFGVFITEVVPNAPDGLPLGLGVYVAHLPPYANWQFLGALSNQVPSRIFNVNWAWDPEIQNCAEIAVQLTLEPPAALIEKLRVGPPPDVRKELARRTALNLFRFLESFGQNLSSVQLQQALDAWFVRFEQKYAKDPNFVLRTE